jgi:hypothetical protein
VILCLISKILAYETTTPENHHKLIGKPSMGVILPTTELLKSFHKYSEGESHVKIGLCWVFILPCEECHQSNSILQLILR